MSAERPWEDLPQVFEMIEGMRSEGKTEEEIVEFLTALDVEAFTKADLAMEEAGVPEEARRELWTQMDSFGDFDPADAEGD